MLPPLSAVAHLATVAVDERTAARIRTGAVLDRIDLGVDGPGPWAVAGTDGTLLAVYEARGAGGVKPSVVMAGR